MTILAIKQADQHKKTLKSVVYKEFYIRFKSQVMYEQHQIPIGTGYAILAEDVIPEDLPWKSAVLIVDAKGNVLASSNSFLNMLGLEATGREGDAEYLESNNLYIASSSSRISKELMSLISGFSPSRALLCH